MKKKQIKTCLSLVALAWATSTVAQSPYILPGTLTDDIADRWDILYDLDSRAHASQRNNARKSLADRAWQMLSSADATNIDRLDALYLLADNNEYTRLLDGSNATDTMSRKKVYDESGMFYYMTDNPDRYNTEIVPNGERDPVFKYFYHTKANFFEVNTDNFSLRANPILDLKYGNGIDDANTIFQNTRGAEIRGLIDDNIYFYTSILENQARFNNFVERRIQNTEAIPGNGFFKTYQSGVIDRLSGYDYLNAQAYVGINATKSVAVEFGHGQHFIGNGIRSMLLSNTGQNYFYLKFNTRIWKFNYQNVFAELAPVSARQNPGDRVLPKKYMANHYLSYKPHRNLEVGIFEAVVFSREDHFEFQYLNPIILYRTVEQFLDSPDNALIGLNGKWNIKNRYQIYGQLMLDEFKLSEITSGNGWWANKYAIQLGVKALNLGGIDHLDAQVEYNRVRPYTYSHRDSLSAFPEVSTASYSHYNQPLAHPLGANFSEIIVDLQYRPSTEWQFRSRIISARYGVDPEGSSFGGNILLRTGLRGSDFGNEIGQGIGTNLLSLSLDMSYQFAHNYFLDLNLMYRSSDAEVDPLDLDTKYFGGGLRVNIGQVGVEY